MWINRTVGTAARNGTNQHTLTFTAASAGSLLVIVIAGAVTHTAITSGYTKEINPVGNSELAVFTKTAAGGETSFVVQHNASNYPIQWAVYEFASGTTYKGDNQAAASNTWPTLSPLTGTYQVFAALSYAVGPATQTFTAGTWTEDVNASTPQASGTDGAQLGIAYRTGQTASSQTPDATFSTSASERGVFAVSETTGTSSVSSDSDLRWRVATRVTSDSDQRWRVSNLVTSDLDQRWRVSAVTQSDADLRWRVMTRVNSDLDQRWRVNGLTQSDADLRWRVSSVVQSDADLRWRASGRVSSDLDARWQVAGTTSVVTSDADLRWAVRALVSSDLDARWRALQSLSAALDARWAVRGTVLGSLTLRWAVDGFLEPVSAAGAMDHRVRPRAEHVTRLAGSASVTRLGP